MGPSFSLDDFFLLDLSPRNKSLPDVSFPRAMTKYINQKKREKVKPLAYGGYFEKRNIYQSPLFKSSLPIRDIHLAIDVWTDAHTSIYAPIDGTVFSLTYNNGILDYGYTLILEHRIYDESFYTLYGHLGASIIDLLQVGMNVKSGQIIGHLGEESENGGWSPHLHCQVILNLEGNIGDFPGVCSEGKRSHYKDNCPDPTFFILPKY